MTDDQKANCYFAPRRSRAALAAMRNKDCGYEFVNDLEKDEADPERKAESLRTFGGGSSTRSATG